MYEEVVRASPSPLLKVLVLFSSRGNAAFPPAFFFFFFYGQAPERDEEFSAGGRFRKKAKKTNKQKQETELCRSGVSTNVCETNLLISICLVELH